MTNYLKKRAQRSRISKMLDAKGSVQSKDEEIIKVFENYYRTLYMSESSPSEEDLDSFLRDLKLTSVVPADRVDLKKPISLQEICMAITSLPTVKAPGPDGLTSKMFKSFTAEVPLFLKLYSMICLIVQSLLPLCTRLQQWYCRNQGRNQQNHAAICQSCVQIWRTKSMQKCWLLGCLH